MASDKGRRAARGTRDGRDGLALTSLCGMQQVVASPTDFWVEGTSGSTILNGNIGLRLGMGSSADIYAGYSRAITGPRWHQDLFRVELRIFY